MQKHSFMVPSHYKPLAVTLLRSGESFFGRIEVISLRTENRTEGLAKRATTFHNGNPFNPHPQQKKCDILYANQRGCGSMKKLHLKLTILTGDAAFQHCWSIVFRVLLELNGMASLSSSSDEGHERVPFGPDSTRRRANNRVIKRVFVHLHNRPRNCSPRGGEWDSLEREARVKTLAFDRSQSGQSMVTMLTSNFPSVAGEDFGQ